MITASSDTSSMRTLTLKITLNENRKEVRFDDQAVWGRVQIESLTSSRIEGFVGPLHFHLDRPSGQLVRSIGAGGRFLVDTGYCVVETGAP
jgi:hypothetical protein